MKYLYRTLVWLLAYLYWTLVWLLALCAAPAFAQTCNSPSGFLQSEGTFKIGDIAAFGPDCNHLQDSSLNSLMPIGCLNIVSFGGAGDGVTDNSAALTAAVSAATTTPATGLGNCIFFPAGIFKFAAGQSVTLPNKVYSLSIVGSGQDSTVLFFPNASGGITFNYSNIGNGVHLRDFSVTTGTTTGGNAITFNQSLSVVNVGVAATTDIYRVTMRGNDGYRLTDYWTTCVQILNVSGTQIDNLTCSGSSTQQGIGVTITGLPGSSTYAVLLDIAKSNFFGLATGLIYGSFVQGVTVDQTNFTFVTQGIANPASETGALVQLAVTNSQFNPGTVSGGQGINTQTAVSAVQLVNNFFVIGGPNQFGILLGQASHCQISYNQLQGINSTSGNGIAIGSAIAGATCDVSHNEIYGWLNSGLGIWLQSGSAGVKVADNNFVSNTTNLLNQGTNNIILNNPGYNPVGPSGISVGASPFTYTAGSSPETIYIFGGTVSSVTFAKNGGGLGTIACSASPCSIELGPFEQTKVTYSATPSMNKMVH